MEAHHVAGRRNHATLIVSVCIDCHRVLSNWQLAAGMDLGHDSADAEWDSARAIIVGVTHLITLFSQRHPAWAGLSSPTATLSGRALSKVLDLIAAVDRVGRWTPDPTTTPAVAAELSWPSCEPSNWATSWIDLIVQVAELLGVPLPITEASMRAAIREPIGCGPDCDPADHTPETMLQLQAIREYSAGIDRMARVLLAMGMPELLDGKAIDESELWSATVFKLLMGALAALGVTGPPT